ncbi:hypothetical protein NA57DRAFT_59461 [Rhizodiscina lignyota]|uniref:Uncharacterized protein n=1 Tax=Rhizodiscina lignyota TaxID=1504668 RepID=A0A9P4M5M5_9PEZI|nr:hypothetical protein NA57DRAFT_59461 [Rhizodiscina lignyota]
MDGYRVEDIIALYIQADKFQVPSLKDAVVSALHDYLKNEYLGDWHLNAIYKGTSDNSKLRKLVVDDFVHRSTLSNDPDYDSSWAEECSMVLLDIARATATDPSGAVESARARFKFGPCSYHEHGDADVCAAPGF